MDKLIERGQQMGLEGPELLKFVTEQQKTEREDRAAEREAEKLKAEVTAEKRRIEAEQEKREAEAEQEMRKVEAEQEKRKAEAEQEMRKVEAEQEKTKAEAEQEMRKVEAEQERRKLELEAEQEKRKVEMEMEAEKIRTDAELQKEKMRIEEEKTKRDEAAAAEKLKLELETERLKLEIAKQNNSSEHEKTLQGSAKLPQLPIFDDGKDTIDSYLERFERFAKIHKWEPASWATVLSALLTGTALETYTRLPIGDAENYNKVKAALLKQYSMTEEGFRLKFRQSKPIENESPSQYITRISCYLGSWIGLAGVTTVNQFRDLIIREQFLNQCPKDVATHLKEKEYVSIEELCTQADRFLEARSKTLKTDTNTGVDNHRGREKESGPDLRQQRECYNCNRLGHIRSECKMEGGGKEQRCMNCKMYGHLSEMCRNTKIAAGNDTNWNSHSNKRKIKDK